MVNATKQRKQQVRKPDYIKQNKKMNKTNKTKENEMSYEILYGRQFVSLGDGTYMPLILSGSNNCTMFRHGREVLERHWWVLGQGDTLAKSREHLIGWISTCTEYSPDSEWFMRSGKWLLAKDMVHWMESGIKSARTIEEIKELLPMQSLHCSVVVYDESKSYSEKGYQVNENDMYISTTEELIKWIYDYNERRNNKGKHERVYPNIEFYGCEPLKLGTKSADSNHPVVCKIGSGYLYQFDVARRSYSYSPDISKAIIFENAEDFHEKTKEMYFAKYKLVKPDLREKNYVIKVGDGRNYGLYVKQKTSRQLLFSYGTEFAKKFPTENAAQSYIDKMLVGRFPSSKTFIVEKIGEKKA